MAYILTINTASQKTIANCYKYAGFYSDSHKDNEISLDQWILKHKKSESVEFLSSISRSWRFAC